MSKVSLKTLPPYSDIAKTLVVGSCYDHYKGHRYRIVGVARHSETREEMVIYQDLNGDYDIWVRPVTMFLENISVEGQLVPRFQLVT